MANAIHNIATAANEATRAAAVTASHRVKMESAFSTIRDVQQGAIEALRHCQRVRDLSLIESVSQTTLTTFATIEITAGNASSRARSICSSSGIKVQNAFRVINNVHKASMAALLDISLAVEASLETPQLPSSARLPGFWSQLSEATRRRYRGLKCLVTDKAKMYRPAPTNSAPKSDAPPSYET